MPFERNPCFTGRTAELESIRQQLFTRHHTARIAITGLGGVGKTNLVIELLFRLREEYQDCSFLWLSATTDESLSQAYYKAAQALRIPGRDDKSADIKQLVQDHLSSKDAGRIVLVFDNADDIDMWVRRPAATQARRLLDYLPKGEHVSILVTMRNKELAFKLISSPTCLVELTELSEGDGKELIRKHLVSQDLLNREDDVAALLQSLTYLPLAIVQASHYINQKSCDLRTYLSLLGEQEEDVVELLSHDFEDHGRRDYDGKNPIATTWLISFKQIRKHDCLAAEYLSFMACVDSKDIPLSLLPPGPSRKRWTDALGTLQGYAFITQRSPDTAIFVHRLVHLAMRNWLRNEGLLAFWTRTVTVKLAGLLADVDLQNRVVWRTYMPHAHYTLQSSLSMKEDRDRAFLSYRYGRHLLHDGRYDEAETQFKELTEVTETKFDTDHPASLTIFNYLALTFQNQGRYAEAEELQVRVLEARQTKLGTDHVDTLASMSNLASTYRYLGRFDEAVNLEMQVVKILQTKLGADDPCTLTSMNNLAVTYQNQGRYDEAEKLQVQVLKASQTKLGTDHPDTLISLNNLSSIFREEGRSDEAEKLQLQVIVALQTKLGTDHPDTLTSMNNLASIYRDQERFDEAEKLLAQIIVALQTKLGTDHPDTLTSMSNLASIYGDQRRSDEAEKLQSQVIVALQTKLGTYHPITLKSMSILASIYRDQERFDEAEKLLAQILKTCQTKLGTDHPDTLKCMSDLALIWAHQGRYTDAVKLMKTCVEARQQRLGPDHKLTLFSLAFLKRWS